MLAAENFMALERLLLLVTVVGLGGEIGPLVASFAADASILSERPLLALENISCIYHL